MAQNPAKVNMNQLLRRFSTHVALLLILVFSASGCVAVAVGVGAMGGYAISRDSFEGVTNKGQDEIWDAATRVLSIMGSIVEDRHKQGQIEGVVYGAHITVSIISVNLTTTKLRVKARKGIFPRIGLAQEVYTKIINQLEE